VSTSFNIRAPAVISAAASNPPAGYFPGSTKELSPNESGLETAAYSLFSNQGGADVNMTVIVFDSQASAQRYTDSVISNVKGLPGYSNDNSTLSSYQRYGTCYAYGEPDPDGSGSIATGVCNKANVYISVHIATTESLPAAEGDVASFVGAAYEAVD